MKGERIYSKVFEGDYNGIIVQMAKVFLCVVSFDMGRNCVVFSHSFSGKR